LPGDHRPVDTDSIGSLQAAEPETGIRGLFDFSKHEPTRSVKEVKQMTISVLDRTGGTADASLSGLHDEAGAVDHELLPCRVNDPELWFAESPADVEFAKTLCVDCPVRSLCLDGALERREPWGVWGGQLFLQGVVIPRKRPRGRPRKNEAAA
jgi:WhiB family transcriptional regulator, redox-sensing transcriptional regulator